MEQWSPIVVALIALAGTVFQGVVMRRDTRKAAVNSAATSVSVEKIHTAVNSDREAREAVITELRQVILELSKDKAALEERVRASHDSTDTV